MSVDWINSQRRGTTCRRDGHQLAAETFDPRVDEVALRAVLYYCKEAVLTFLPFISVHFTKSCRKKAGSISPSVAS